MPGSASQDREDVAKAGTLSVFSTPGMDCATEAGLVRVTLGEDPAVVSLDIDLELRQVKVMHTGDPEAVRARLAGLGFGAELLSAQETAFDGGHPAMNVASERSVLRVVLAINATMFVVELVAGLLAESTGLLADSLDMLADALVYAVGLLVVGRSIIAQHRAALLAGGLQLVLGLGVLVEVARRAVIGSDPTSPTMVATAGVALVANLVCARLLHTHRQGGAHMKASWIFTATDAVANLGVMLAGVLVWATGSGVPDLVIGTAIALIVLHGAIRIVRMATASAAK